MLRKTGNLGNQGLTSQNIRATHSTSINPDFEINNNVTMDHHPRIQDPGFKGIKPRKNVAAGIRNIVNP